MTTQFLFANNATSILAAPVTIGATTLQLEAGTGSLFPNPGASQVTAITLVDAATGLINEIVYCTAITGDVMTVTRAQENTTAKNWKVGDYVGNYLTAGTAANFGQNGVTQIVAGTNVTISPTSGKGAVTINATGGVNELLAGAGISVSSATGNVTVGNTGILGVAAGSGMNVSVSAGVATLTNSGVLAVTAGSNITVSQTGGTVTINANAPTLTIGTTPIAGGVVGGMLYENASGDLGITNLLYTAGGGFTFSGVTGGQKGAGTLNVAGLYVGGVAVALQGSVVASLAAGAGISVSGSGGNLTVANTGITSVVAGANVTVSTSAGVATVSAAAAPVVPASATAAASSNPTIPDSTGLFLVTGSVLPAGSTTTTITLPANPVDGWLQTITFQGTQQPAYVANTGQSLVAPPARYMGQGTSVQFWYDGSGELGTAKRWYPVTVVSADGGAFSGTAVYPANTLGAAVSTLNGLVSQLQGTAGQITVTQSGQVFTLSLPNAVAFPGTAASLGFADGSSASSGYVGQYIDSANGSPSTIPTPTNVPTGAPGSIVVAAVNAPLVLPAGDWDIEGVVTITQNGSTSSNVANVLVGISTVNNSLPAASYIANDCTIGTRLSVGSKTIPLVPLRATNAGAQTFYPIVQANYSASSGTIGATAFLKARRAR